MGGSGVQLSSTRRLPPNTCGSHSTRLSLHLGFPGLRPYVKRDAADGVVLSLRFLEWMQANI